MINFGTIGETFGGATVVYLREESFKKYGPVSHFRL